MRSCLICGEVNWYLGCQALSYALIKLYKYVNKLKNLLEFDTQNCLLQTTKKQYPPLVFHGCKSGDSWRRFNRDRKVIKIIVRVKFKCVCGAKVDIWSTCSNLHQINDIKHIHPKMSKGSCITWSCIMWSRIACNKWIPKVSYEINYYDY